ncbi:MAG: SufD family Fe-S cluster assembly protein [Thermoleophilia bacterium]
MSTPARWSWWARGAKATVVDRYTSADLGSPVAVSTAVELVVLPEGELEHVAVVDWGAGVRHHARVTASAHKDARVRSVMVTLGGDVVRVEATMVASGPGSDSRALGVYFADGNQHFEHRVVSRHEAPQAYSNLLYKGALKDTAHTVFFGNLVVPPGAPGTDAYQTNRNLVLNDGARADTIRSWRSPRPRSSARTPAPSAGSTTNTSSPHLAGVPTEIAKRLIVIGFPAGGARNRFVSRTCAPNSSTRWRRSSREHRRRGGRRRPGGTSG